VSITPELAKDVLRHVVQRLGELSEQLVFLGGATTGLLITDSAITASRVTTDLDCIVEATSRTAYYNIELELASLGIFPQPEGPLCRFRVDDIDLDIMPTSGSILGFTNKWYPEAFKTATTRDLGEGVSARVVAPYCFVATKLEAFEDRGKEDYLASHDLEDLITVVNGRPELSEELRAHASHEMRAHVAARLTAYLKQERFLDAIDGHLPPDAGNQLRREVVLMRLRALAGLA
jgi:predicted nucleotidyltransferase